ncbi:MAG: phage minor head protein [Gammaproteobacteria bacterium]|nr:phage minor head protein [Gammaproteobacteria bacterium]
MASINEELRSRAVSHAIYLERYKSGVWARLAALLDRADNDLIAELQKRAVSSEFTQYRLGLLLDAVREMSQETGVKFREQLRAEMRAIGAYELEYQQRSLGATLPKAIAVDLGVVAPSVSLVYSAAFSQPFQGRLLREWGASLEKAKLVKVQEAIRMGIVEGETAAQIVQRIRGTRALRYKDGVLALARRQTEAIVRTAVNHTVTQAREQLYAANPDLIKGWQFVATLDSRTTPECQSLDGRVFPIGEGPMPPRHVNCRSATIPITKSYRELGINRDELPPGSRASMNGQVPATETYGSWIKKQSADVQNEALGKTRAQLMRAGGLTVDKFVDRKGHSYTLDQLRSREAAAFEKAGIE